MARSAPRRPSALLIVALVAACSSAPPGGAATPPVAATPSASVVPSAAPPSAGQSDPASQAPSPPAAVTLTQPWATAELTDVRTGEPLSIAALVADGQVVFIETMAIWCTNCRRQQIDVVTALSQLGAANVRWIGVDVDPSESADALATYSHELGFDWPFVVADADLARSLATEFGDAVLAPPSTPIIVVGTRGQVTLTEFGHKSVERIVTLAHEHGA